ncbi:MAG TPA: FtsX-like permease family protein, partial [Thermoanaerobaculia bacterium]|nr:FtsX-like permease family protein [Thermoanaerobaculia bacterium]
LFEKDAGGRGGPVFRYMVSPGYCETLQIPLLRGRAFESRDDLPASPGAVLISESLARREFGSRDPLGQRLRMGPDDAPWLTIVGVVGDVKQLSLALDDAAAVYVTPAHWPWPDRARSLAVRAEGDAAALVRPIRQAIWSVDKDQPIVRIATMDTLLAASAAERRFAFVLFEVFALAALGLAAIGIYGVLAGGVVERTREIGVRAALGASRGSILALVTRQGLALAGLGVGIGLVGAMLASRALTTLLFGVTRLDPATYLGMIAVLLAVAALACVLPAWRAARIDPAITLRAE